MLGGFRLAAQAPGLLQWRRMREPRLLVTFPCAAPERALIEAGLGGAAPVAWLADLGATERAATLGSAAVILARHTGKELRPDEPPLLAGARLLQFMTAGVDYIPLRALPADLPIACNGGAYAEPMAEHAVAMTFAAAKRLLVEQRNLEQGVFNQFVPNRYLAGAVCGILGFGGIGVATARRLRALGLKVHAINRRGTTSEAIDWIGTPDRLGELLGAADVLVISLPLTRRTERLIGALELQQMKHDAILVNLARGEILDEDALYAHLEANPEFTACLDAWWIEPVRHGRFAMDRPFLSLPNVVASPHNSASVAGVREMAFRSALENCRRALRGEAPLHLIGEEERVL
jgi:phosphoglycerate dehydrogenase-like enzyme